MPVTTSLFHEPVPEQVIGAVALAHPSWHPVLRDGLQAMMDADSGYLPALVKDAYLPENGRLFAAFMQPVDAVRYVLVGEGPYPRPESATGVCFMDGAVKALWSEKGLSKPVNRATSLRNFMKMLLVIEGLLVTEQTSGDALQSVAKDANAPDTTLIQTRSDLQDNLFSNGFLLLNASLVFRSSVPPLKDARAWQPLMSKVLQALADHASSRQKPLPTLVLWGKVAEVMSGMTQTDQFPKAISEHPYNLTFIGNPLMQTLFKPMRLLQRRA